MSGWSPSPFPRLPLVGIVVVYALLVLYAVLVQGSVLVAILPGVAFVVVYVVWRFLVALEAIADGVHRLADRREED